VKLPPVCHPSYRRPAGLPRRHCFAMESMDVNQNSIHCQNCRFAMESMDVNQNSIHCQNCRFAMESMDANQNSTHYRNLRKNGQPVYHPAKGESMHRGANQSRNSRKMMKKTRRKMDGAMIHSKMNGHRVCRPVMRDSMSHNVN
jgi:hypothetical protein